MYDHLFWLSEQQFGRLKPLLPDKVRGVARVDDRRVILPKDDDSGLAVKSLTPQPKQAPSTPGVMCDQTSKAKLAAGGARTSGLFGISS